MIQARIQDEIDAVVISTYVIIRVIGQFVSVKAALTRIFYSKTVPQEEEGKGYLISKIKILMTYFYAHTYLKKFIK